MLPDAAPSITALLGPTNTGKTHRAIERMLEHDSGMLGLPLRLLAREVYDRVTRLTGESEVALITGEEKRIGARPRYWICTVEAMPVSKAVDFLAVDEIQLAAHSQRGHVFTDRLLNARGQRETWFLGAATLAPLVARLLPDARIVRHPRLSRLSHVGTRTLSQLPPRSAVVAFSMNRVYELAERIRRRAGGVAVVLGALSPRARNAQVALYESGEVDYLVATDAIGMGLNLAIDNVAFAEWRKFDGRESRDLEPAELAQIAGRAGRHLDHGSFGALSPLPALPQAVAARIEQHRFFPERQLFWRRAALDTSSVVRLLESLRTPSPDRCLRPVENAEDTSALLELGRVRPELTARATTPDTVALLWEVCRIPDYRQLTLGQHVALLAEIFGQLTSPRGVLDPDWLGAQLRRIDDVEADIDTLLARIAFVRTWTYVSHHADWLARAGEWQARTLAIEDRLSEALHEKLLERFVDRGKTTRARVPQSSRQGSKANPFERLLELKAAMTRGSEPSEPWVERLVDADHEQFKLNVDGKLIAGERVIGRIARGSDLLRPELVLSLPDEVGAGARLRLQRRLSAWLRDLVNAMVCPVARESGEAWSPALRGLCYQLERGLGTELVTSAATQLDALTDHDRALLRRSGIRLGCHVVYSSHALRHQSVVQRVALVRAHYGIDIAAPNAGSVSVPRRQELPCQVYTAIGYPCAGSRAIRADVLEHVVAGLARGSVAPSRAASWLGCSRKDALSVLHALGAPRTLTGDVRPRRRRRRPGGKTKRTLEPA